MEELLSKAKINKPLLKRALTKIVGTNLSRLSEPCFYPAIRKNYHELLRICGLTERDVKDFTKRRWGKRKEFRFKVHMDPKSNFYIFLMQYFLLERDQKSFLTAMIFFIVRYYTNLMFKQIEFCNPALFKYALEHLTKTHLFSREKTIPNALYYLSKEMVKKYQNDLKSNDLDRISKFMQESRTRISQSIKSFAGTYYKASREGTGITTLPEPAEAEEDTYQYQVVEKSIRSVDEVTRKITVYKFIDKKAKEEAKKLTRVGSELAELIPSGLTNTKYSDDIRITLQLFVKDLKNVNVICGKAYYEYVRRLMALKRTKSTLYFKQRINILLLKVLGDIKFKKKYESLTSQTKSLVNLFLAYYLTMALRNTIC